MEELEFSGNNPGATIGPLNELAKSPLPSVAAGALARLGRNFRKLKRYPEAISAYEKLSRLAQSEVFGLPADLVSLTGRCSVLEQQGDRKELLKTAQAMDAGLRSGRWMITGATWAFHRREAERSGSAATFSAAERDRFILSHAATLWFDDPRSPGVYVLQPEGSPSLVVCKEERGTRRAAIAGPAFLDRLLREIDPGVRGTVIDARSVRVEVIYPSADLSNAATRERMVLGGFGVLALVLAAGSLVIVRSIHRDHAVGRLQSEFVAAVSHEFRTPLTSMRQLSEMLFSGRIRREDERQESYALLVQESERLQRLVESLLDFGRMEARAARYHFVSCEPNALVVSLVADFQRQASALGYKIELSTAENLPSLELDREALGLALWNLLDNAVKYSPDCRTVWIETSQEEDRIAISVRDEGIGVPSCREKADIREICSRLGPQEGQGERDRDRPGDGSAYS